MADNSANIYPYPLQFDPSQWSNKYSPYAGQKLPSLANYSGTPTDAHGNPIGSYQAFLAQQAASPPPPTPGTTLNSSPTYGLQPSDLAGPSALNPSGNQAFGMATWGGMMSPQAQQLYANQQFASPGQARGSAPMPNQAQAAPQAPPVQAPDMGQAYLAALSNPGKVTTPGATVPQAPLPSQSSGVLQQFLQNWQGKGSPTTGAGNYNNQGFFSGLQGGQPSA
jgi:hypothetical protein